MQVYTFLDILISVVHINKQSYEELEEPSEVYSRIF